MFRKTRTSIFYVAPGSTEQQQQLVDRSHIISGPMSDGGSGARRRNRANQSMLAIAFQNAWKQGNLAAQVSQPSSGYCGAHTRHSMDNYVMVELWLQWHTYH